MRWVSNKKKYPKLLNSWIVSFDGTLEKKTGKSIVEKSISNTSEMEVKNITVLATFTFAAQGFYKKA